MSARPAIWRVSAEWESWRLLSRKMANLHRSNIQGDTPDEQTYFDRFGRIDALVNIAGAVAGVDLFQMTEEQWNTGIELSSTAHAG